MSQDENAKLVRHLLECLATRDVAGIEAALDEDVVWHFPGHAGQLAGDHSGRQGVFEFLTKVVELTGETFGLDVIDVLSSADRAAVLFTGHGEREGARLDNPTCLVMAIREGKITELWEYVWDLTHVEAFWQ